MRIVKHINNNFAVAEDGSGNRCIVSGKGIGFGALPREINLADVNCTYYEVDPIYFSIIGTLPEETIEASSKIVEYARTKLDAPFNGSLIFTLADHINFAIERFRKKTNFKSPIINDIKFLYEKEMEVGEYGLKVISKDLGVRLPKDEAAYIALNIINAEKSCTEKTIDYDELIDSVIQIVEKENNIKINRNDFSCSRFITHMHYMLKRAEDNHMFNSEENRFMKSMKNECQDTYECVQEISGFLKDKLSIDITEEEKLYLMMHIHRLCTREACNI